MLFIALMSLSTTAVASIAAFFSIYGLAHTFTGAFWSVVAMGSSLEAGKLMLASFVYRFKDAIGWRIKTPAYAFIMVLMLITSTGIYGYLSAAYQADSAGSQEVTASLQLKQQEQKTLQDRKVQIDAQISQLPTNNVKGRQALIKQFAPEEKQIDDQLSKVTADIQDMSQKQIQANAHIGPIVYIAKMFGMTPDKAISILCFMIIFVFDPLAMLLTISTNIAIEKYQLKKEAEKAAEQDRNKDDEDVFRGKGWEPKKSYYSSELVEEGLKAAGVPPPQPKLTDYFTQEEIDQAFDEIKADDPALILDPVLEVEPEPGPEITGNWAIDRYNEDYHEPNSTVPEQKAEETPPVTDDQLPEWYHQMKPFKFFDRPPEIVGPEQIEPLDKEPIIEQEEALPLNEEPVYDMQASPVIEEIKQIEQEIEQKPELSQEEQEMRDMIKRFFNRQDLIRSTRRD